MTAADGNGFTTKEMLIRLEGKVDTVLRQHTELVAVVANHTADGHNEVVKDLANKQQREEGRRDMLRIMFGTSIIGAIAGGIALAGFVLRIQ